jgi:hypothetical protein
VKHVAADVFKHHLGEVTRAINWRPTPRPL